MSQQRRGLGRGLDALLGSSAPASKEAGVLPAAAGPGEGRPAANAEVDIDLISPNPEQPRTRFDPESLRELAASIRVHGVLQPLLVSRHPGGGYRLVAGERRLQAARLAGLATVPVVLRETADAQLLELALVENIQRADLNPIEQALAFRRLADEYGLTQEAIGERVGRSRVAVANSLRLLGLEADIRRSIVGGEISEGHARALLGLAPGRARLAAWREVVARGLSVRETEALVRRVASLDAGGGGGRDPGARRRDPALVDVEARLRQALGTRVTVVSRKDGARITIDAYSAEELDAVLAAILGDDD